MPMKITRNPLVCDYSLNQDGLLKRKVLPTSKWGSRELDRNSIPAGETMEVPCAVEFYLDTYDSEREYE